MSSHAHTPIAANVCLGAEFAANASFLDVAPGIRLAENRLHEATGPAALSLALCAAGATSGAVFWIGDRRSMSGLRARGVRNFIGERKLTCVHTANRRETLWAAEEAMRCPASALVVCEVDLGPDLFESRRLQIAAQAGGSIGLVLIGKRAQHSAAQTRWHCDTDTAHRHGWVWEIQKDRQGQPRAFSVDVEFAPAAVWPSDLVGSVAQTLKQGDEHAKACVTAIPRCLAAPTPA